MIKQILAFMLILVLTVSLVACGSGEETTLSGMVLSVDGTVITLAEMNGENFGGKEFPGGERPEPPEGADKPADGIPEAFNGTLPEGETFPSWGNGERPEMPEGMTPPEGMNPPEGMTIPENGERPAFSGSDEKRPGLEKFAENMQTTQIDIGDAHISVEENGIKATGSLSDLKAGVFVTISKDRKGNVTNVLITSTFRFGQGFQGRNPS